MPYDRSIDLHTGKMAEAAEPVLATGMKWPPR